MNWTAFLEFVRGPLFQAALLIFVAGMVYRLVRVVGLGWSRDRVPALGSKAGGVVKTYAKALLILPFIPWVKNTATKNPIIYLAGGLFHLGLFTVILLGTPHMLVWKSLLGFGWPTLPLPIVDWLAVVAIAVHDRLADPPPGESGHEANHGASGMAQLGIRVSTHADRLHHDPPSLLRL